MKFRLLSVFAAAVLLAACSSAPEDDGGAAGMGAGTGAGSSMGSMAEPVHTGPAAGSAEEFMTVVGDRVFFGFNEYNLTSEAQATLRDQARWLSRYADRTLIVEGHADERGTREYNLALGERRANSVKEFLVGQGVDPHRLRVVSFGKERPVCGESTESCWSQNRRGVTVLQ
jgi:peptidoglycan-associated lipoprotein